MKCLGCKKDFVQNIYTPKQKFCSRTCYIRVRSEEEKERDRKRSRDYYWECKNKDPKGFKEKRKLWAMNGRKKNPLRDRNRGLKTKYKMTHEDYLKMLEDQGQKCAICCGESQKVHFVVDHDHNCCPQEITCGKCIRGLLCDRCNTALGRFDEDPDRLIRAANYLTKGRAAYASGYKSKSSKK